MIVYRLARAPFAALDGEGARRYGGRWNSPGRSMIYSAASPSLAVLEVMVHLDLAADLLPPDYRLLTIEVPNDAPIEALDATPLETHACVAAGDKFLVRGAALVLTVPSVVVPQERNALINPLHPAAAGLRMIGNESFRFDPRLLAGGA